MEDLSKYRLDDNDKYWMLYAIEEMGFIRFIRFAYKVIDALDRLIPGKHYDIREVAEDKQEVFIKISCVYIQTHPEVVFYSDYSKIEKLILPEKRKENKRLWFNDEDRK